MIPRQFLHRDPVAISYLIGCVGYGTGAVVDPLFPIEPYIHAAAAGRPVRATTDDAVGDYIYAPDVADDVREELTLRILTEKAGPHVDPREAIAVCREARNLFVSEPCADRKTFEPLALLEELLEPATVARGDFDQRRDFLDGAFQVFDFARCHFERIG